MAKIKIDPTVLKSMTYVGRHTHVVFELTPKQPALLKAMGSSTAVVAQATARCDAPLGIGVSLDDLFAFVQATQVCDLELSGGIIQIGGEGISAKFPAVTSPEGMVEWEAGTFAKLPPEFVQAVGNFSKLADNAGSLEAALFVKAGHLIVTDGVRWVRAVAGDIGDMVLAPFDPRLLQGMIEYLNLSQRVVFQGGGTQVTVAKVVQEYPPDLEPAEDGVPLSLDKRQLKAAPGDVVTIFAQEGRMTLQSKEGFEVTMDVGPATQPIHVSFNKRAMLDGMLDDTTVDITTIGGRLQVLRIQKPGYLYLLAETMG